MLDDLHPIGAALTLPRPIDTTLTLGLLRWAQRRPDFTDRDEYTAFVGLVGDGLRARRG
ncbi:hypothetical protein [Embleya hyalina]|uniref:hypothetical protein n=1 Tax=Embleya hyalina TaxID=516124 RepID=UPI001358E73E|nr:hypothetical protein [Embleya hyalina]